MMSPDCPPLPSIDDPELLLQVYTHQSIQSDEQEFVENIGDNDRLEDLGAKALELAITQRLFDKKPLISAIEIAESRKNLLSESNLHEVVTAYSMKKNLKCSPSKREEIKTPAVSRALLHTYLGAVYSKKGLTPIIVWAKGLVDPDNITTASSAPQNYSKLPSQPPNTPPRLPPTPTSIPDTPQGQNFLALFNEHCQKERINVEWSQQSSGLAHRMQWTVKCVINGSERGVGTASNTKQAKTIAAKEAARNLGLHI